MKLPAEVLLLGTSGKKLVPIANVEVTHGLKGTCMSSGSNGGGSWKLVPISDRSPKARRWQQHPYC